MSITELPGWKFIGGGSWGTNVNVSTSILKSGVASLLFPSACVDATTISSEYFPIDPGCVYKIRAWVRADSVAAGANATIGIYYINAAGDSEGWQYILNDAVVGAAANTWYQYEKILDFTSLNAGASAKGWLIAGRAAKNPGFNLYVGLHDIQKIPRQARVYADTASNHTTSGAWEIIHFNQENYDHGSCFDTTNHQWAAPCNMTVHVTAHVLINHAPAVGDYFGIAIFVDGAQVAVGDYKAMATAHFYQSLQVANDIYVTKGQLIEIRWFQNHAANVETTTGSAEVYASFREVSE